jgi:hypothetical protein
MHKDQLLESIRLEMLGLYGDTKDEKRLPVLSPISGASNYEKRPIGFYLAITGTPHHGSLLFLRHPGNSFSLTYWDSELHPLSTARIRYVYPSCPSDLKPKYQKLWAMCRDLFNVLSGEASC